MSLKAFVSKLNRRDTPLFPKVSKLFKITFFSLAIIGVSFFAVRSLASENALKDTVNGMKHIGLDKWLGLDVPRISSVGILNMLTNIKDAPQSVIDGGTTPTTYLGPTWIPGGFIGSLNNAVAYLYNRPASGVEYLAQAKDTFLGKPVYAATSGGIGFNGLQPILPIWRAFRNVVYILSSFVFIVIGLMIMLRVKISPQAVINLQNSIPQLITALILVTFSYAIAGLIIDFMYLFQSLAIATLFQGFGKGLTSNLLTSSPSGGSLNLLQNSNFSTLANFSFGDAFALAVKNVPVLTIMGLGAAVGAILGLFMVGIVGVPLGAVLMLLAVCILIVFLICKFLVGLVKCYINLILKIVIGPLEIGMGAFPNSKIGFSSWIMDVISNAAVFPISLVFLILVNLIAENSKGLWTPSIIALSGGTTNFLPAIIGLGGFMLLAKLPEMIPEFIFKIKPSPWGAAIGKSFQEIDPRNSGLYKTGKAGTQQNVHNRLDTFSQHSGGPLGKFAGNVASGMELSGLAKETKPST